MRPARERSPFAIRGTLPWHNFLSGPSVWNEEDYAAYLDRLAGLGLNFVGFHCYTGGFGRYSPYVEPMIRIKYRDVLPEARFDTSRTARWGYRPLPIKDFAFGTSKLYSPPNEAQAFGSRCAVLADGNEARYRRAQVLMKRVLEMAHARGIQVAMGFEFGIHPPELASIVPPESRLGGTMLPDPTHTSSIEILRLTINDILSAYPTIDWVWLWLHEHTMKVDEASMSGSFRTLYNRHASLFKEAGSSSISLTGVWSLAYIQQAYAFLARQAPGVRVAIGGWGGGTQLTQLLQGLDRALPKDVVFAPLNPGQGTNPQPDFLADIAKNRPVWAIPWLEGDASLWHLQPRVKLMREHVALAYKQNLSGVVGIHWRTAETRTNLNALARFARNPEETPSVEAVYREDVESQCGKTAAAELAPLLARADREGWFKSLASPEYYPYHPTWGRVTPKLKERLTELIAKFEQLSERATDVHHQEHLDWFAAKLQFTLLLDEVGRKMEPAYRFKERWLLGAFDGEELDSEIARVRQTLHAAPMEELFHTYARRVRSRGELGVLSALNQKLWLQYRELEDFLLAVEREKK